MDDQETSPKSNNRLMQRGMLVCCAAMLLPIAAYSLAGGSLLGSWGNIGVSALLLACVGAHFAMHKSAGKTCHEQNDGEREQPLIIKRQVAGLR
jgi:hypothetical protein